MNPVFLFLILAVGLFGAFLNIRMLRVYCVSNKTMRTSLQKIRPFAICLFTYQVMILTTNSIEAWKGFDYIEHERSCFLSTIRDSLLLPLTFNTAAVALLAACSDSTGLGKIRIEVSTKKLLCAAQVSGGIGAAAVWLNCHEFVSDAVLPSVMVLGLLLLVVAVVSNTHFDQTNDEMEKSCSLSEKLTKNKACWLSAVWLLLCSGSVIIIGINISRCREIFGVQNMFYSIAFMDNFIAGIYLPLVFIYLFKANFEEQNALKTQVTIVC